MALTALFFSQPEMIILDEPTNNLDAAARERLLQMIDDSPAPMVVISHDRELLNHADEIAELYHGSLRMFSGNFEHYHQTIDHEQETVRAEVSEAKASYRKEIRQRAEMQTRLARNARRGKEFATSKRKPGMAMGNDKNRSQVSSAKRARDAAASVSQAREGYDLAQLRLRDDTHVHIELPDTSLPNATRVLGSELLTIVGPNASDSPVLMAREKLRFSTGLPAATSTMRCPTATYVNASHCRRARACGSWSRKAIRRLTRSLSATSWRNCCSRMTVSTPRWGSFPEASGSVPSAHACCLLLPPRSSCYLMSRLITWISPPWTGSSTFSPLTAER